jgi:hypothetical protein
VKHPSIESWCNSRFSPGSLVSARVLQYMNRYPIQFPRGSLRNRWHDLTLRCRRSSNGMKNRPLAFILPSLPRPRSNLMLSYSQFMKLVRDLLSHASSLQDSKSRPSMRFLSSREASGEPELSLSRFATPRPDRALVSQFLLPAR